MSARINYAAMVIGYVSLSLDVEQFEWRLPLDYPGDFRCSPEWFLLVYESGRPADPLRYAYSSFLRWSLPSVLGHRLREEQSAYEAQFRTYEVQTEYSRMVESLFQQ